MAEILDVDLLAFERGDAAARRAVVDGVRRSLETGFVTTSHDVPEEVIDAAYDGLAEFFHLPQEQKQRFVAPGSHGQTGYTGLLVETAATSDVPDWKEMLNFGDQIPAGHPLRTRYPHRYRDQVLPESAVPGITEVLLRFHDRHPRPATPLPPGHRRGPRRPRVAVRADAAPRHHAHPGDPLPADDRGSGRRPRVGG